MSIVSRIVPSREAKFLASLNNPPRERFYVIEPRGTNHSYLVCDRANSLFIRSFRNGDDAHKEAKALNANPPAPKPLFPVRDASVRVTPEPLIRKATTESCWRCGELCPSDGNADPLYCAKCREAARSAAVHAVTGLADGALVELAAAAADEIARRLHSAA